MLDAMKKFTAFTCIISLLLAMATVHAVPLIKGLRISGTPDKLRLVFDLTEPVSNQVFTLDNPQRLVVDLQGASFENAIPALPPNVDFVQRIRSYFDNGSLRVVLDLNEPVDSDNFWLPPNVVANVGHRLVLDVERIGKTIPVESPRQPTTGIGISSFTSNTNTSASLHTTYNANDSNRLHHQKKTPSFADILRSDSNVAYGHTRRPITRNRVDVQLNSNQTSDVARHNYTSVQRPGIRVNRYRVGVDSNVAARTDNRVSAAAPKPFTNRSTTSHISRVSVPDPVPTQTTSRVNSRRVVTRPKVVTRVSLPSTPNSQLGYRLTRVRQVPQSSASHQAFNNRTNTKAAAAARLAMGTSEWPNLQSVRGRDLVIIVDAGHGGRDSGAVGPRGTKEKDIVLSIARKLARIINMQPGMHAVLTRSRDVFIPLRGRVRIARRHHADLFVSIHADAAYNRNAQGASVYTLSERGASSAKARAVAARENSSDLIDGISINQREEPLLARVLLDMSLSASMEASRQAAWNVLQRLNQIGNIHKNSVQYAGFAVLKAQDIPSMLVETAFISNYQEEVKLSKSVYQRRIVDAIFSGIQEFFRNRPPPGTRLAQAMQLAQ